MNRQPQNRSKGRFSVPFNCYRSLHLSERAIIVNSDLALFIATTLCFIIVKWLAIQNVKYWRDTLNQLILIDIRGSACIMYIWQYIRGLQNSSSHSHSEFEDISWFGWSSGLQSVGLYESAVRQSGSEACRHGQAHDTHERCNMNMRIGGLDRLDFVEQELLSSRY